MFDIAHERCKWLFDALVPIRCALCARAGAHVCARCQKRLAESPLVRRPNAGEMPAVTALGAYSGALRRAVLGLKFRNRREAAAMLSRILAQRLLDAERSRDAKDSADRSQPASSAVVPVPLHAGRLLARGFNQAESVASAIAAAWRLPCFANALVRRRATSQQSSLQLRDRTHNVRDAFAPGPDADSLRGRRVVLVDDVVTTGATIASCARVARRAGAAEVEAIALAIKL